MAILEKDYDFKNYKIDDKGWVIEIRLEKQKYYDDGAMDQVRKFKKLKILSLGWSSVSDAGIDKIQDLKRIENLTIVSTPITDRGLAYLAKMPSLKNVWLTTSDNLTPAGVESLKKAVSGIRVHVMN